MKNNITCYSIRLNLDDERHKRVNDTLKDLNMGIHKSINQFFIDAADYYIKSFEDVELTNEALKRKKEDQEFIAKEDLLRVREKLYSDVKEEIIRVLGTIITGGQIISSKKPETNENKEEDPILTSLADKWG